MTRQQRTPSALPDGDRKQGAATSAPVLMGAAGSERLGAAVQTEPSGAVFSALGSSPRGLSSGEVAARQARYGPNELPSAGRRHAWRQLAAQFTDLLAPW